MKHALLSRNIKTQVKGLVCEPESDVKAADFVLWVNGGVQFLSRQSLVFPVAMSTPSKKTTVLAVNFSSFPNN